MPRNRNDERRGRSEIEETDLEAVRSELARVRARFGVDPAVPAPVLSSPWTSPSGTIEDDEAELVDVLADCASVGLPLNAAVASWASGCLAQVEETEEPAEVIPFAEMRLLARRRVVVR